MDIAQLLARPHDMNVGDGARYLEGFAAEMASVGYTPLTIGGYLDSVIHFGGWLLARGLSLTAIDEEIVKAFGAHRCKCPGRRSYPGVSRAYMARVERFIRYLGQRGVIRSNVTTVPEASSSLIAFREWLLQHRGLAQVTVDRHEHLLKQMLPALGADTGLYTAATVRATILGQIRGRRPAYAKTFVGASESTCDSGRQVAFVRLASTMRCPPWRNGNCPRCRDISTPDKPPSSMIRAAGMDLWDRGIEPSCCCYSDWGFAPATSPACVRPISTGRRPRFWFEVRGGGMSGPRCHKTRAMRCWNIWNTSARASRLTESFSAQTHHSDRCARVALYPILFEGLSVPQESRTHQPAEPISSGTLPQPQCSAPEPLWTRSESS